MRKEVILKDEEVTKVNGGYSLDVGATLDDNTQYGLDDNTTLTDTTSATTSSTTATTNSINIYKG